jgi:hypothetical protein
LPLAYLYVFQQPFQFELLATMIPGEIIYRLHHLLLHCPANIWHAIKTNIQYDYSLQLAINLNDFQYETLLLASGILNKRGNLLCISRQHIEELQTALQENIILHYSKAKVQRNGTHNYYICIGEPTHWDPIIQARIPVPVADQRVDCQHQLQIEHLCYNRQQEENALPELLVLEDVPELVEEEEAVIEEEQLAEDDNEQLPYQRTHFYQNELARFDEAYLRWVNERYEHKRLLFKQQQEQLYNDAIVLGAEVGGQQMQEEEHDNVPLEEHFDENLVDDGNNNIIIDDPVDEDDEIIIKMKRMMLILLLLNWMPKKMIMLLLLMMVLLRIPRWIVV